MGDMPPPVPEDPWALLQRPPVVIPADELESTEAQWRIWAAMPVSQRMELAEQMIGLALEQRHQRIQRRYPDADAQGLSWAIIREILELEPGTAPVPR